nr:PREDICTED: uncharacterized protein LOC109037761 [Bemisia tabaci]
MLHLRGCVLILSAAYLVRETQCATQLQTQVTVPSAKEVGQAVGQAGNWAGNQVNNAGQVAGNVVNGAGNLAGQAVNGAGNLAGQAVSGAGNLAGQAVSGVGRAAGTVVNGAGQVLNGAGQLGQQAVSGLGNAAQNVGNFAGNVVNGIGNGLTYAVTAGGRTIQAAGQAITNVAMFPINVARGTYTDLQMRMMKMQLQMAAYKQAVANSYNYSSPQYAYQSAMFDQIAIVDLTPYVNSLNADLTPYGQMVRITRTNGVPAYIFPTILDANAASHSLPNGFSLQANQIVNARGQVVGAAPQYQPSYNGKVLNDAAGNQYVLGPDIYLDQQGNLLYRRNNQPWAIAGQYVIDLGGNVYDSGGNIIGNLCRCFGITGSFGPNGAIVLQ